ncbi:3-isopropylmalate dehydrogenase [Paenibacillus sp. PK3_47]|uniref:isocitrate/isopropylmalate dehydrogenase family protein n=1 Tax=Paenibacillus sp. PK3_47 TaxID=2072642 RepID=UPI00201E38E9|nr:isocitrate/isopropylmalate dehydrogenase family protein [Paenibacillus sp. PK3_47]UQZ36146.1 3-isopropylmalate dehydrogenase [Paenibacillus sp. PK3_47]
MNTYQLGALYGDGIGPEITQAAVDILGAASRLAEVSIEFVTLPMGWTAIKEYGNPMPQQTKDTLEKLHGWIMGPHDSAAYPQEYQEGRNPSGELRHYFDLYSNVRPARNLPGIKGVVADTDLVIFRENTEGFYSDRNMYAGTGEWQITEDVVVSTGVFTRKAVERIAHEAFRMAVQRRKKVTIVHKANVIKLGSGLFKNVCLEVAAKYPEVQVDDYHIDAMTAHLVRRAQDFDVIVTENMFGDILSDLTGELVGSLGLAPSINTSDKLAMAQAAHGSAPDKAGQNIANPVGIILSSVMLLDWLSARHADTSLKTAGELIGKALFKTMEDGVKTRDLKGTASTAEFTAAVIANLNDV